MCQGLVNISVTQKDELTFLNVHSGIFMSTGLFSLIYFCRVYIVYTITLFLTASTIVMIRKEVL